MGLTTVLHILLTVLTWDTSHLASRYVCIASILWIAIIVFSVLPASSHQQSCEAMGGWISSGGLDHSEKGAVDSNSGGKLIVLKVAIYDMHCPLYQRSVRLDG